MPERIFSEGLLLPDGRKVRVLAYDDGSVRLRLDGTPYVMEECFLSGGRGDHAIVKLTPRGVASMATVAPEPGTLEQQIQTLLVQLEAAHASDDDQQPGYIVRRHKREGALAVLRLFLMDDTTAEEGAA